MVSPHIHVPRCVLQIAAALLLSAFAGVGQAPAQTAGTNDYLRGPNEQIYQANGATYDVADDLAAQHLRENLSDEDYADFRLFIYVDKGQSGLLAQRMYVFDKMDDGSLALLYDWPVSTGRNRTEPDAKGRLQSTLTPSGFFELDPKRMFEDHLSSQWDEAMPYAMFFDWKPKGHATGLAIHGTPDANLAELGTAASAGCIRLSVENAQVLFDMIRTQFRGPAPKLAYLDGDDGTSSQGLLLHDQAGNLKMADGYSVLVFIDDFGGTDQVASLSWAASGP
jgi:lipoprotein-anchoring transpeptidase ErfK/SrfK